MAILDKTKKPYIADRDNKVFIGIDLPIRKSDGSEGYFASTSTTIEAVKNNIKNLVSTEKGERLMQPTFGLGIKKYLFNPFTDETILNIQTDISDTFNFWLPFVQIKDLEVSMNESDSIGKNKMLINIMFSIKHDPNTIDSVQIEIGE